MNKHNEIEISKFTPLLDFGKLKNKKTDMGA